MMQACWWCGQDMTEDVLIRVCATTQCVHPGCWWAWKNAGMPEEPEKPAVHPRTEVRRV